MTEEESSIHLVNANELINRKNNKKEDLEQRAGK